MTQFDFAEDKGAIQQLVQRFPDGAAVISAAPPAHR